MDHTGIDVHTRESQICSLADGGEPIERRIRTEPQRFVAMVRRVCYGCGPSTSSTLFRGAAMSLETRGLERWNPISRRTFLGGVGMVAGVAAVAPRVAVAQAPAPGPATPLSTVTTPPRDFTPGAAPTTYVDPDVITIDPLFNSYRQGNTPILRLWTGALWSEGPAWSGQGRYLVWSDIPNNRQLRWMEDDGRVTVFRSPSNNSNGNTFDFQGRQLSCEHLTRRVVRYEHDGSVTIIADSYEGKRLNSPNDVVPHPDGSYWFTDPPTAGSCTRARWTRRAGRRNRAGRIKQRLGQPRRSAA